MKIFILTAYILFATFTNLLNAKNTPSKTIKHKEILVGFYGRPYTKSLGILGENNINKLVSKMKNKQDYYEKELDYQIKVRMAFHIIHSLATKDPGRRNDYLLNMSEKTVMKYINKAKEEDFEVILDVQLGVKTALQAIKPLLKYLKFDNVHIAIDPEFKIPTHRRYPPGKYVGYINASDLNETQKLISNYLKEHKINQKRKLIVHMFHEKMLRKKGDVKNFENIELLYNIDGHGHRSVKTKIYNSLYAKDQTHKAIGGFKVFYNSDAKPLMKPKQILGFEAVGSQKILEQPYYINYH